MTSQYDKIETAVDLVREVKMHGLSITQVDICRAQDIIGHSTVEEIAFLADGGEKDCYGNANDYIQRTLFQIIFACWDRDRAVALYNEHVTRYPQRLKEVQEQFHAETQEHAETKNKLEHEKLQHRKASAEADSLQRDLNEMIDAHKAAEFEIQRLKAKLYDLMTAGA
jgi:hypothetical protein